MARKRKQNKVEILARQAAAFKLRGCGMSFRAIGERLGISHVQAQADVSAATAEFRAEMSESIADMIALENLRLDAAQLAIWPRVLKGDLEAIDRELAIHRARCRLNGLYPPKKIAHTTPDGKQPSRPVPEPDDDDFDLLESIARVRELLREAQERKDEAEATPATAPRSDVEFPFTAWGDVKSQRG